MTVTEAGPAILNYITEGAYPESDSLAASEPTAEDLSRLIQNLRQVQSDVKIEIQHLSRSTGPSVDQWIAQAKQLEADIQRSRETARQIVSEAEQAKKLHSAQVQDAGAKVEFLESEVDFNDRLVGTLEHVRHANGLLGQVQDHIVAGQMVKAVSKLEDAQASVEALRSMEGSQTYHLLQAKTERMAESLRDAATLSWNALLVVDHSQRKFTVHQRVGQGDANINVLGHELVATVDAVGQLGLSPSLLARLAKDLERTIVFPRLSVDNNGRVPQIRESGESIACADVGDDTSYPSLFRDLVSLIDFLTSRLPALIVRSLSGLLMPQLLSRLKEEWLEPAIPLSVSELHEFQDILDGIGGLAEKLESDGWTDADALHEWVESAPTMWLTKRREAVLGDVRNLVFTGLRENHEVERVETQLVEKDGMPAAGANEGDGDEWDNAWEEPEELQKPQAHPAQGPKDAADDDDEANAWGAEDDADGTGEKVEDGEDDAWGWDGEEGADNTSRPQASKNSPSASKAEPATGGTTASKPAQQEMTLRETYIVTGVPGALDKLLQQVILDAQALAGPDYAASPIAPVAKALYTLPTLALAIYRATASTAYSQLAKGNILLYNDSSRLAEQLRAWQASQPSSSRLRLDNDVGALENFAKRAYSSEMEAQRTILRDLLDGAQGFGNCTASPNKGECESAVDQTVDRLRDVRQLWANTLASSALLQSLGSLLSSVLSKILTDIMDLPDISEADSAQLKHLCDRASSAKDLFAQQGPDGSLSDMTFIYCPMWLKFQYLAEILESSLADIKYLWSEGELRLEFDAEEVVGLIEALFADSGLRKQAIMEVRRGEKG